jgi:hypothetical protein
LHRIRFSLTFGNLEDFSTTGAVWFSQLLPFAWPRYLGLSFFLKYLPSQQLPCSFYSSSRSRLAQTQCSLGAASFSQLSTVSSAAGTECSSPQGLDWHDLGVSESSGRIPIPYECSF